jgi:hypothetical protein
MELKEIISKVKTKKWKNLGDEAITEKINLFLKRNPKVKIDDLNEKEAKSIIKFVRQEMHRSYGAFQSDVAKRDKLLEEFRKEKDTDKKENIKLKILKTHSSTRERLDFYDELKEKLNKFIEGKIILDLGAGLNSLIFDENKIIAIEFNKNDIDFLNKYFRLINENKIIKNKEEKKSIAILLDLTKKENIDKLNKLKFDVIFAWKLFDLLNSDVIEAILKLNAETIIASFSTKTLGNREMNFPKRIWFEKKLNEMNLKYETMQFENEIFYVIK